MRRHSLTTRCPLSRHKKATKNKASARLGRYDQQMRQMESSYACFCTRNKKNLASCHHFVQSRVYWPKVGKRRRLAVKWRWPSFIPVQGALPAGTMEMGTNELVTLGVNSLLWEGVIEGVRMGCIYVVGCWSKLVFPAMLRSGGLFFYIVLECNLYCLIILPFLLSFLSPLLFSFSLFNTLFWLFLFRHKTALLAVAGHGFLLVMFAFVCLNWNWTAICFFFFFCGLDYIMTSQSEREPLSPNDYGIRRPLQSQFSQGSSLDGTNTNSLWYRRPRRAQALQNDGK